MPKKSCSHCGGNLSDSDNECALVKRNGEVVGRLCCVSCLEYAHEPVAPREKLTLDQRIALLHVAVDLLGSHGYLAERKQCLRDTYKTVRKLLLKGGRRAAEQE